jgi:hypothetical protein
MTMRQGVFIAVAATAALAALTGLPALAAVPGTAALAARPDASAAGTSVVTSVSCASAGNCAAGGIFSSADQTVNSGFVLDERNGRWGRATLVHGTAAPAFSQVNSVSCPSAGNCGAGGFYGNHAFVVSERNGRWSKVIIVPAAGLESVAAAGRCVAVGGVEAFLVSEFHGRWGRARSVPGLASLTGPFPGIPEAANSVSCGSAGNCVIGGDYRGRLHGIAPDEPAFLVTEKNGRWGKAFQVPGMAALNSAGLSSTPTINSVSCASAGNCVAGGYYETHAGLCGLNGEGVPGSGGCQAFVVSEKNGRWGKAIEVPGTAALNVGGYAAVTSASCGSAGNCVAGGFYYRASTGPTGAFVVREKNGRWRKAFEVPGLASLSGAFLEVNSVSCASDGNCVGGGDSDASPAFTCGACPGFVVGLNHGVWHKAETVRF